MLVQSESLFYGSIYGIYLRALHGADVGFFLRAVNQVFSGGVLAGGERHALGEIEGFSFGCRSDDNVGAVLLDSFRHGVQDVAAIDAGQVGKPAVEGISNVTVVFEIGYQQGQGRFRVTAFFRLFQVAGGIRLEVGHGTEHPVVATFVRFASVG